MSEAAFRRDMMRVKKYLDITGKIDPLKGVAISGALNDAFADGYNAALEAAAEEAYLQVMLSAKRPRRTKRLGLRRETTCVEYASEVQSAIRALNNEGKSTEEKEC